MLFNMATEQHTPLTTRDVTELTGIPKSTVLYALTNGELPARKLPGKTGSWIIDREQVDAWIERREARA